MKRFYNSNKRKKREIHVNERYNRPMNFHFVGLNNFQRIFILNLEKKL